jgi:hypothetical protein
LPSPSLTLSTHSCFHFPLHSTPPSPIFSMAPESTFQSQSSTAYYRPGLSGAVSEVGASCSGRLLPLPSFEGSPGLTAKTVSYMAGRGCWLSSGSLGLSPWTPSLWPCYMVWAFLRKAAGSERECLKGIHFGLGI